MLKELIVSVVSGIIVALILQIFRFGGSRRQAGPRQSMSYAAAPARRSGGGGLLRFILAVGGGIALAYGAAPFILGRHFRNFGGDYDRFDRDFGGFASHAPMLILTVVATDHRLGISVGPDAALTGTPMADLLGFEDETQYRTAVHTVPVLLPLPLDLTYDYIAPEGEALRPGDFVLVPIGPRKEVGVVWERSADAKPVDPKKLKAIVERFELPPLPETARRFADWVARYTLSPRGMVLKMMMSAYEVFSPDTPRWGYRLAGPAPVRMTAERKRVIEAAEGEPDLAEGGTRRTRRRQLWRDRRPCAGGHLHARRTAARQAAFAKGGFRPTGSVGGAGLCRPCAAGAGRGGRLLGVADRRRHRLGQDGGLFRGGGGSPAPASPGADPAAGNRADQSVFAALRGALRLPAAGMAFGDFARRAGAYLARAWRKARRKWWRARVRRCSCPSPISG